MIIVETDRLVLRELGAADAPFVLDLLNSPGFLRNIGDRAVRTLKQAGAYLEDRVFASYARNGFGMWAVDERETGRTVGLAGLVRREGLTMPDVGYAFLPQAWGRGYAQEAAAAVVAHGRAGLGLTALAAITTPDNQASMAVLRKIGFIERGRITLPGVDGDSTYFTSEA